MLVHNACSCAFSGASVRARRHKWPSLRASVLCRSRDALDPATRDVLTPLLCAATRGAMQQRQLAARAPKERTLRHRTADGAADLCAQYRARWQRILANVGLSEGQQVRVCPRWQQADALRAAVARRVRTLQPCGAGARSARANTVQ
jgi:hypothetical protein